MPRPPITKQTPISKQTPTKKPSTASIFNQLIDQAYTLAQFTKEMDLGGYEQRLQAKQILSELERLMQLDNHWTLWQLLEASLIPKMTRLAKDINLYKSILKVPTKKDRAQPPSRAKKKYLHHLTHQSSAYNNFQSTIKSVVLTDQQHQEIAQLLTGLREQLAQYQTGDDDDV